VSSARNETFDTPGTDDVGNAELAEQPGAVSKRSVEHGHGVGVALFGLARVATLAEQPHPLEQRRLELGHREEAPLVEQTTVGGAERGRQAGPGVSVGEVETDGCRLVEDPTVVELERGHAPERVSEHMLGLLLRIACHQRELVGRSDLLERPQRPCRAAAWHVVEPH
jgi:hypothetical protein